MLFPHTESRRIALRPARTADAARVYDLLFRLGTRPLPMLDTFVDTFGRGLSACFVVQPKDSDELAGFATLSELVPAGHLRVDVIVAAGEPDQVLTDATALTTNFAFAMWRTRKVYYHATDQRVASIGFTGDHAQMVRAEAVLPQHSYFHGRHWDVHVFAVYREQWDMYGTDLLKQIL